MDVVMPRMDGLQACRRLMSAWGSPTCFQRVPPGSRQRFGPAAAPFAELQRSLDTALEDRALGPGDIRFIDNFQAVHGRKPFKARYDGNDRWPKRINVVRDLRQSRDSRLSAASRVLY